MICVVWRLCYSNVELQKLDDWTEASGTIPLNSKAQQSEQRVAEHEVV